MEKIVYLFAIITGTLIASLAVYVIPVLLTCSFAFNWSGPAKFLLTVAMAVQFIFSWGKVAESFDYERRE